VSEGVQQAVVLDFANEEVVGLGREARFGTEEVKEPGLGEDAGFPGALGAMPRQLRDQLLFGGAGGRVKADVEVLSLAVLAYLIKGLGHSHLMSVSRGRVAANLAYRGGQASP
jgi:hypothetical protein